MAEPTHPNPLPPPPSQEAQLARLRASATQHYALKNYPAAADFYSEAAELQDTLNGEMSPENADLLYQYGRCLYHVAVSKSDVLGGRVAGKEKEGPRGKKRKVAAGAGAVTSGEGRSGGVIGDAMMDGELKVGEDVVEQKDEVKKEDDATTSSKPYFQITGDENWTDSEASSDDAAADASAEEDEDDFATAYEILDLARLLLTRKLETSQAEGDTTTPEQRQLKERLADTHDLQAEISLENERFQDAINDTRDTLALKLQLYPQENSLVAEAHFKLSLALEFASVTSTTTSTGQEGEGEKDAVAQVDEEMRASAATEMEKAIASCRLRIAKEEESLLTLAKDPAKDKEAAERQQKSIRDVQEMVAEMQQRLVDLRNPAVSLSASNVNGLAGAPSDGNDPLQGVLGAMLGESQAEQRKRLAEATEGARDLSGLVRVRKRGKVGVENNGGEGTTVEGEGMGKGKRKVEDAGGDGEDGGNGNGNRNGNGKKVKFESGA